MSPCLIVGIAITLPLLSLFIDAVMFPVACSNSITGALTLLSLYWVDAFFPYKVIFFEGMSNIIESSALYSTTASNESLEILKSIVSFFITMVVSIAPFLFLAGNVSVFIFGEIEGRVIFFPGFIVSCIAVKLL